VSVQKRNQRGEPSPEAQKEESPAKGDFFLEVPLKESREPFSRVSNLKELL
jgi:hypothetical protein